MTLSKTDIELAKQLPKFGGMIQFYRLRWRFEFHHKPPKVGVWNAGSKKIEDMAVSVNKTGLARVVIEGEKVGSWSIHRFFDVDGQLYSHMQWEAVAASPAFMKATSFKSQGNICGLSVWTDKLKITAFIDGQIKTRQLTDHEKKYKFLEHSSGV